MNLAPGAVRESILPMLTGDLWNGAHRHEQACYVLRLETATMQQKYPYPIGCAMLRLLEITGTVAAEGKTSGRWVDRKIEKMLKSCKMFTKLRSVAESEP